MADQQQYCHSRIMFNQSVPQTWTQTLYFLGFGDQNSNSIVFEVFPLLSQLVITNMTTLDCSSSSTLEGSFTGDVLGLILRTRAVLTSSQLHFLQFLFFCFSTRQILSSLCLMQILALFNHAYAEDSVRKQRL